MNTNRYHKKILSLGGISLSLVFLACSMNRSVECYKCFSTSALTQNYLASAEAAFSWQLTGEPGSEFKVVLTKDKTLIDTADKANINETTDSITLVMDWVESLPVIQFSSLDAGQTYTAGLLEKNQFGRIRLVETREFKTQPIDYPQAAGAPKSSQVKKSSVEISFPSVTDSKTLPSDMQYLVAFWPASYGYTLKEDILASNEGITVFQNWKVGEVKEYQTVILTGLKVETDYTVGILARDGDGNVTLLPLLNVRTLDQSAPEAGEISKKSVTETSALLGWDAAVDEDTSAEQLEYRVFIAESLGSLADARLLASIDSKSAEPKLLSDWTAGLKEFNATGLKIGVQYYFTVVVRDLGQHVASYKTLGVVLSDLTAPVFPSTSLSFSRGQFAVQRDSSGKSIFTEAKALAYPPIAKDNATSADAIEYKTACSRSSQNIDTIAEVITDAAGAERGNWEKIVTPVVNSYSINLHSMDRMSLTPYCNSPAVLQRNGENIYNPKTAELQDANPKTISNLCKTLAPYAIISNYALTGTRWQCTYTGVGGKLYTSVVARDASGNMSLVGPGQFAHTDDVNAPTFPSAPIMSASGRISWTAASDYFTPQQYLQYKVVYASTAEAIDSVDEINAVTATGNGLVTDWSEGITAAMASTGLSNYFAVAVRDEVGNVAVSKAVTPTNSSDTTAPSLADSKLKITGISGTSISFSWVAATDNSTPAANLTYRIYLSAANPSYQSFDTLSEVEAGTFLTSGTNVTKASVTSLTSGSSYYFAVVVSDLAGNKTLYTPLGEYFSSNLVLHYPFDGNANDVSNTGNNGILGNSPTLTADRYGGTEGAYSFSSSLQQRISSTSQIGISGSSARTVAVWLKANTISATLGSVLLSWGGNSGSSNATFGFYFSSSAQLTGWTYGDDANTAQTISTGTWHHLVFTGTGSTYGLYQNGSSVSITSTPGTLATVNSVLIIGTAVNAGTMLDTTRYFDGYVDDVKIFNTALTSDQVTKLYNSSKP